MRRTLVKKRILGVCAPCEGAVIAVVLVTLSIVAGGCDRHAATNGQSDATTTRQNRSGGAAETSRTASMTSQASSSQWEVVEESELSGEQRARLERARRAQSELASKMMGLVMRTAQERGFPAAVTVCHGEAPKLAGRVAEEHDLQIGRTSFRLRNQKNTPPEWAREFVERRVDETRISRRGDDVALLSPIRVAEPCLNCHGTEERLAEGVSEALARHYPDDRATGFEAGDLRGWFWVEVD
jgi:hypothetical protein